MSEGLDLIRIGKPLRPEFAAWRYGDQLGRRRVAAFARSAVGLVAIATVNPLQGVAMIAAGLQSHRSLLNLGDIALLATSRKVIGRITTSAGEQVIIRNRHVDKTELLPATATEPWGLLLNHGAPRREDRWTSRIDPRRYETAVRGDEAARVARDILPRINRHGASAGQLKESVGLLESYRDANALFKHTAGVAHRSKFENGDRGTFLTLRPELRLALEMASQEDLEQRALEGELQLLETAWREAEEIAAIADNMFVPRAVLDALAHLKERVLR
ncbi:MAG TPA: hypothetical protein VM099_01005 [Gemmatimonadaceae bacterium]|nr:hypothetical protein [Gemmatimonadaceae bacterium]